MKQEEFCFEEVQIVMKGSLSLKWETNSSLWQLRLNDTEYLLYLSVTPAQKVYKGPFIWLFELH